MDSSTPTSPPQPLDSQEPTWRRMTTSAPLLWSSTDAPTTAMSCTPPPPMNTPSPPSLPRCAGRVGRGEPLRVHTLARELGSRRNTGGPSHRSTSLPVYLSPCTRPPISYSSDSLASPCLVATDSLSRALPADPTPPPTHPLPGRGRLPDGLHRIGQGLEERREGAEAGGRVLPRMMMGWGRPWTQPVTH